MKKKPVSQKEHDRIVNTLYDELKRKDEWILRLKEESSITMRASIRQAEKYTDLIDKNRQLVEENHIKSEMIKDLKKKLNGKIPGKSKQPKDSHHSGSKQPKR